MSEQAIRDRIRTSSSWRVAKQLGRGQYGTAYLVQWGGEDTEVAAAGDQAVAKVVGLEFLPEKEQAMAFQEVELLRELKHPGIVSLRDHFMTEASLELVIVMEFCDAGDLRGEVKRRTQVKPPDHIPEVQIMTWLVQLVLALNHMHGRHILHRDLKSSNIFLITNAHEGRDVKIGDFGISRVLEGTVDVAATVVGTPYYMSPEVCKAEAYGFKSDVWALGCVLYEMCMLKHAFESQSLLGLVYKIVSEAYDPIPNQYSPDLRSLIDRLLDKSHYTRPSGKELVADPYVRKFLPSPSMKEAPDARKFGPAAKSPELPRASLAATMKSSQIPRGWEPSPLPPSTAVPPPAAAPTSTAVLPAVPPSPAAPNEERQPVSEEQPARREWFAAPAPAAARKFDEAELRAKVYINRIRRALALRRQNWLQIFASFDRDGNGQLAESEFDCAVTSMALGLSDGEIREVRALLQGSGPCVPVYEFGKALHGVHPQVTQLEEWGRSVLLDLTREAARLEGSSNSVAAGATVRVVGLQSAAGVALNGSEGNCESWDTTACRWVVRLTDGALKSIRDENLEVLRPAAAQPTAAGGLLMTTALYRMLCEGGETAISEARFLSVLAKLLPKLDNGEQRRLLWLLPKSPEGRVDVPEVLSQLVQSGQIKVQGAPGARQGPVPAPKMPPSFVNGQPNPGAARGPLPFSPPGKVAQAPLISAPGVPGTVPSPRARMHYVPPPGSAMPGGGGATSSRAQVSSGEGARADVALLRLAQRLAGRSSAPGPGLEVLKLFAAKPEEIRQEEFSHAVSVLPLGISRAEVAGLFDYVRAFGGQQAGAGAQLAAGTLSFEELRPAVDAALRAGLPPEAATLERLKEKKLAPALQKAASSGQCLGRASPQEFRVMLMQAEPYLTHSQLEWLMMLTDKDGEGRLLPASLLARLGWSDGCISPSHRGPKVLVVPPRPVSSCRVPVAPHTPRSLVVASALARVRDRLSRSGPNLRLEHVLGLFLDIPALPASGPSLGRDVLATLLGHLRLGISAAEADELVNSCVNRAGEEHVPLANLFEKLQRATEPELEDPVEELREAARNRLRGQGSALASAAAALELGEWLPEAEFRGCLSSVFTDEAVPLSEEEEERLLLLAEKTAGGESQWRPFVAAYAGLRDREELEFQSVESAAGPAPKSTFSPCSPKTLASPQNQKFDRADPSCSTQSWRAAKLGHRTPMAAAHMATEPMPDASKDPFLVQKPGFCPCRRRCK